MNRVVGAFKFAKVECLHSIPLFNLIPVFSCHLFRPNLILKPLDLTFVDEEDIARITLHCFLDEFFKSMDVKPSVFPLQSDKIETPVLRQDFSISTLVEGQLDQVPVKVSRHQFSALSWKKMVAESAHVDFSFLRDVPILPEMLI